MQCIKLIELIFEIFIYLDVMDLGGSLKYWAKYSGGTGKFITAKEAKETQPELLVDYLEQNLTF